MWLIQLHWAYIRMHSGQWNVGYTDEELSIWVEHIRSFLMQEINVYVYFNNDPDGNAIRDAQRLYSLLGCC
ncbi:MULTISPECIES: DUF72 domain-containing protein [unclassified Nostoc]|uniref:DUF72 domain-containing protein n=1 Tax=unclassified Nostoc TaxID=2593658 RepID=UPI0021AB3492|nr:MULTISPECIES: DUF72 domain-containing protein [unclassified Nostoc]